MPEAQKCAAKKLRRPILRVEKESTAVESRRDCGLQAMTERKLAARRRAVVEGVVLDSDVNGLNALDRGGGLGNPQQGEIGSRKSRLVGIAVAMLYFCFGCKGMNCRGFIDREPDKTIGERGRDGSDRQDDHQTAQAKESPL